MVLFNHDHIPDEGDIFRLLECVIKSFRDRILFNDDADSASGHGLRVGIRFEYGCLRGETGCRSYFKSMGIGFAATGWLALVQRGERY